jgi:hypothetical protein
VLQTSYLPSLWHRYADYKRFHEIFAALPEAGNEFVDWASIGLRGNDSAGEGIQRETTFWFGSAGSQVKQRCRDRGKGNSNSGSEINEDRAAQT